MPPPGGYSVTYTVVDNATKQIDAINRKIAASRAPMERMTKSASKFLDVSGIRKIADGFSGIARTAGMAVRSLGPMVPMLGAITSTAVITGMVKLAGSFAQWGNQLQTNADQIGMNTTELQQFQDATVRAGGNADDMTNALKNLHKNAVDSLTGMNTTATAFFKQFHIDVTDAQGNLRDTGDVLKDVFKALDSLPEPADRARVSSALLSDEQAKLYETYKQSGMSLQDFLDIEAKQQQMTPAQLKAANDYRLAIGALTDDFNHLQRGIGAMTAEAFEPLVKDLDTFVTENGPAIESLFKDIAATIVEAADAMHKFLELFGLANRKWTKEDVLQNSPFYRTLTDEQKASVRKEVGVSDADDAAARAKREGGTTTFSSDPWGWLKNRVLHRGEGNVGGGTDEPGAADRAAKWLSDQTGSTLVDQGKAAAMNQLPGDYSWGDYGTRANNPGNMNWAPWQRAEHKFDYTDPQTGGQHTMAVYDTMQEGIADNYRLLQRNQEKYGKTLSGALHGWAENGYIDPLAKSMGTTADAPFDIATADPQVVARMMGDQYRREGRRGSHTATQEQILEGIGLARGPVAEPPQTAPPNGTVNVDITHKNAPPDATVTARGSGAIAINPIRIELPQHSFSGA